MNTPSSFWNFRKSGIFALTALILASIGLAQAQSILGEGDFSKLKQKFTSLESGKSASYRSDQLSLNFSSASLGSFGISFKESPQPARDAIVSSNNIEVKDSSEVLLLRGTGQFNGNSIPVAGAVFRVDGHQELHVNFIAPGSNVPSEIVKNLDDGSEATLKIAPLEALQGKKCGQELFPKIDAQFSAHLPAKSIHSEAVNANVVYREIDIATEADYDYYVKFGSSSNSRIAATINAAQIIYERDLGLRFNIVRQRVATTPSQPYTSTDSGILLDQLGSVVSSGGGLQGADVVHLFTGKDIDENVVGLAWVGVLCTNPEISTSFTQELDSTLDFIIFAHEVGHNLGAPHDESEPPTVMYPSVGETQTSFSATSISMINAHLNAGGASCLTLVDTDPTPPTDGDPRGGGDDEDVPGDDGSGDEEQEPYLDFSAKFSAKTGKVEIEILRNYFWEGRCTFRLRLGGKANLSDSVKIQKNSTSDYLYFTSKTTKRLSDTKAKIYVQGEVTNCEGGEMEIKSEILTIKPSSSRTTKRGDKVSAKSWNQAVFKKYSFTEY